MSGKTNEFSQDFLEFVSVGGGSSNQKDSLFNNYECCVGEGCNEGRFIFGSFGSGSDGLLTYCADCYSKVKNVSSIDDSISEIIAATIIIAEPTIETSNALLDLSKRDYTEMFVDRNEMIEHLVLVNAKNVEYFAKLKISDTVELSYKMIPNYCSTVCILQHC
jgi:hypothetical protein